MSVKTGAILAAIFPACLFSLDQKPWLTPICEFELSPFYSFDYFCKVDNAKPQLKRTFHTHVLGGSLGVTAPEDWSWETELEFASATPFSWGYRSFAFQIRKLWMDDIIGDPVSLSTGLVYRDASTRLRKALSTPYHGRANFELHCSVGREWCQGPYWIFRAFGLAALGQATSGLPWIRANLTVEGNVGDRHQWKIFAESYFGLGNETTVLTKEFSGWGDIGHHSIDVGGGYGYHSCIYGTLRFDYSHRVYAHSYPEHVNFFLFTYTLPFSIL